MKIIVTKRIVTSLITDPKVGSVYDVPDNIGQHLVEIGVAKEAKNNRTKKAKEPEVEQPEVEQPEVEQPEVEQPEVEQPEVEQPEVEQPVTKRKRKRKTKTKK